MEHVQTLRVNGNGQGGEGTDAPKVDKKNNRKPRVKLHNGRGHSSRHQGSGRNMAYSRDNWQGGSRSSVNWPTLAGLAVTMVVNIVMLGWFAGTTSNELKTIQALRTEDKLAYQRIIDDIKADFRVYKERTDSELRHNSKITADVEVIKNQIVTMNAAVQEVKTSVNTFQVTQGAGRKQ